MKAISPKHRRLVDVYLGLGCNLAATAQAIGMSANAVGAALKRPEVKAYLTQRQDDLTAALTVSTSEIVSLLVSHMRGDIADLFPDDPVLKQAKADGVSRNIRKLKIKETVRRVKTGESHKEDEVIDRNVEIELYSSQTAGAQLSKIFGLDSEDDLQRGRTAIKMYCEWKDCTPGEAIVALAPHVPAVLKVKDEFLRSQPLLGSGE